MIRVAWAGAALWAIMWTAPSPAAQGLPPETLLALQRAKVPAEAMSVVVHDASTGQRVLQWQATRPVNPASLTKLLTTMAALERPVSYTHLDVYKRQAWRKAGQSRLVTLDAGACEGRGTCGAGSVEDSGVTAATAAVVADVDVYKRQPSANGQPRASPAPMPSNACLRSRRAPI